MVLLEMPPANPRLEKAINKCADHLRTEGFEVIIVRRGDPDQGIITTVTVIEGISVT